jgi:UDP-2,3-diacylglucosamine hydrolase
MTAKKTYFIADAHLRMEPDPKRKIMKSFLDMLIKQKADLYILGDFFDFWANNKEVLSLHIDVLSKLNSLTSQGSKVGFLVGNRDFLLSEKTLKNFGIDHIGEETLIELDSQNIFLAHGHTLCRSDVKFLKYKERAWPLFIFLDKFVPGIIENYIVNKFMLQSKKTIAKQDPETFKITGNLLQYYFDNGCDVIICGHVHNLEQNITENKQFYSLPAWEEDKGNYLLYENNKFTFNYYNG